MEESEVKEKREKKKRKKKRSKDSQARCVPMKKTPYQGKKRCFGEYMCMECENKWTSAYSWANTWQMCFNCMVTIYPHKQYPLKKKSGNSKTEHLRDLCGKCRELGVPCKIKTKSENHQSNSKTV